MKKKEKLECNYAIKNCTPKCKDRLKCLAGEFEERTFESYFSDLMVRHVQAQAELKKYYDKKIFEA